VSAVVVLDAGPLGLLTNANNSPQPLACRAWLASLQAAGRRVVVPEITDYELRRELIRIQSHSALANLDAYGARLDYLPLTTAVMRRAAELWAQARSAGQPTAPDPALDVDVILAAQAMSLNAPVVVATGNPAHLTRFVSAELWSNITPYAMLRRTCGSKGPSARRRSPTPGRRSTPSRCWAKRSPARSSTPPPSRCCCKATRG